MIDLMRLMSIFGNLGQQGQEYNSPMDFKTPPFVPQQTFGGGFQSAPPINPFQQPQQQPFNPERTMQDKFMELIQGFPQRDTNPSGWRKIGALLTGLGGENAGEAMSLSNTALNLPHINRVQDWITQTKPTMEAAENERLYNQYEQNRLIAQQKADEAERYNRERIRTTDEKLEEQRRAALTREERLAEETAIRRRYVEIAEFKKENPDYKWFEVQGGNIVGIHPQTGEVIDSKIPTGTATDVEKARLQLQNALSLEDARQKGRIELATTPRPPTTHITTGGSGGANELEVQRRVENRKRRMMIERKDLYDWIDPNTGTYKRNTPPNIQQEIADYIYGEKEPAGLSGVGFGGNKPAGTGTNQPPPQQRPANRPAPPDTPRVRSDGKVFVWDNETGQYGYVLRDAVTKAKTADGKMRFEVIR